MTAKIEIYVFFENYNHRGVLDFDSVWPHFDPHFGHFCEAATERKNNFFQKKKNRANFFHTSSQETWYGVPRPLITTLTRKKAQKTAFWDISLIFVLLYGPRKFWKSVENFKKNLKSCFLIPNHPRSRYDTIRMLQTNHAWKIGSLVLIMLGFKYATTL